ncbi:MAG: hypothetical protein ACE5E9_13755 [Nitrospinaceae bacterium]
MKVVMGLVIILLLAGAAGCKEKGPAEKAGEKVDKALDQAGNKVNDLLGK